LQKRWKIPLTVNFLIESSFNLGSHTFNYLNENLSCLFYGVDVLATRYAFFASYHDLLADISEAFGVWVALLVLVVSSLTVLVSIQQTTSFSWESTKSNTTETNSSSNLTAYRTFTKFISKNKSNL
jgi:hypothetical protein